MTSMESKEVKELAMSLGASMVGIAPADGFDSTQFRRAPDNVLPSAKSIIVFAKPMLEGSIESPREEVATIQNMVLYQALDQIAYELGLFLESRGCRAATIPAYLPVEMTAETKGFVGVVSLRHAGQAAGMGVIGKNNLLLTPSHGPRVRLGAVVTSAEIPSDRPALDDLCSECNACIVACPVDALSQPGKTDTKTCVRKVLPYGLSNLIKYLYEITEDDKDKTKQTFREARLWNLYQTLQLGLQYGCHGCVNACPVGRKTS